MANVTAKLRCLALRGETVHTRWGHVSFDGNGLSSLEVPEEELQMLRDIRPFSWLAEDHGIPAEPSPADPPAAPPADPPAAPPADPQKAGKARK